MSDAVLVAIIGVTGTVIGSVVTLLVAALQARRAAPPATLPGQLVDPTPILGEAKILSDGQRYGFLLGVCQAAQQYMEAGAAGWLTRRLR